VDLKPEMRKWKVFLGENATGKTSVLHAIGLALMGEDFAQRKFNTRKWLTRKNGKVAHRGRIALLLNNGEKIELTFSRSGMEFNQGAAGAQTFLRGYGAIRLSRRQGSVASPSPMNVDNLWDMHHKLPSARAWLARMKEDFVRPTLVALRDLLLLSADTPIKRKGARIEIPLHGSHFDTDELSAGYQDLLNVVIDVISGFPGGLSDMNNAYGVILIDELGVHLHPRWKMQLVASLKSCFPGVQFIATTHDPLCLRELDEDEVVVMERDENGTYALTDLPSPRNMRVDQLLTSRFFGLQSTVDPRLDRDFREYYELLADPAQRNSDKFVALKRRLAQVSALGFTKRDQILYALIDEFLAQDIQQRRYVRDLGIPEDLRQRIRAEWMRITDLPEEPL
jgi:hypothetical protein